MSENRRKAVSSGAEQRNRKSEEKLTEKSRTSSGAAKDSSAPKITVSKPTTNGKSHSTPSTSTTTSTASKTNPRMSAASAKIHVQQKKPTTGKNIQIEKSQSNAGHSFKDKPSFNENPSVLSSSDLSDSVLSTDLSLSSSVSSVKQETKLRASGSTSITATTGSFQLPSTPSRVAFSSSSRLSVHRRPLDPSPVRTPRRHLQRRSDISLYPSTPDYCFSNVQVETPRSCRRASMTPGIGSSVGESSLLTVAVRIRPLNTKESQDPTITPVTSVQENEILIASEYGQNYSFVYDHCFDDAKEQESGQDFVYRALAQNLLYKTFQGFNTCLFAYGQTGSGKSYSIMGAESRDIELENNNKSLRQGAGIVPRFCLELFEKITQTLAGNTSLVPNGEPPPTQVAVEMSYFEIYKEKIQDLLLCTSEQSGTKPSLKVREHPVLGPYVVDLTTNVVKSYQELQTWLQLGNKRRVTAATAANERSSRSHSVLTITLTQSHEEFVDSKAHTLNRKSKINIVDLAGSERVAQVNSTGERRQEGVQINQSLLTLGRVIQALADVSAGKKNVFVPYRESILTWLLKESLGGNSRTAMLATVSPASCHFEETLSTLRYACQARTILNVARINEDPSAKIIRQLRAELEQYRRMHEMQPQAGWSVAVETVVTTSGGAETRVESTDQCDSKLEAQICELKIKLEKAEQEKLKELAHAKSWEEKLAETERRRNQEMEDLSSSGISHRLDSRFPCLVNLTSDPSLSNMLYFVLKDGGTKIGSVKSTRNDSYHSILLEGHLIQPTHCVILNSKNRLLLSPGAEGETYINGHLIKIETVLHHGDRLVLGPSHFFRVHHPKDPEPNLALTGTCSYQFVYEELYRIQNERLQTEAELAKAEAKDELEAELKRQKELYEKYILDLEGNLDTQRMDFDHFVRNRVNQAVISESFSPIHENEGNAWDSMSRWLSEPVSSIPVFQLAQMVTEANAICGSLKKPYEFSYRGVLPEMFRRAILVNDKENNMTTLFSVHRFEGALESLRDLAEGEGSVQDLFNSNDVWEPTSDGRNSGPVAKAHTPNDVWECSFATIDDSFNVTLDENHSMDSSYRRRSLLASPHRYNSLPGKRGLASHPDSGIAVARAALESLQKVQRQRGLLSQIMHQLVSLSQTVHNLRQIWQPSSLPGLLVSKDGQVGTTALTVFSTTSFLLLSLPTWVEQVLGQHPTYVDREEIPVSIQKNLVSEAESLVSRLQNAVAFVLQGLECQRAGFAEDWARKSEEVVKEILRLLGCVLTMCDTVEMAFETLLNETHCYFFTSCLLVGFQEAHTSLYQVLIERGDQLRSFIINLPDESIASDSQNSSSSSLHSSSLSLGQSSSSWLIKACYDCICQTLNVMENCHPLSIKAAGLEDANSCQTSLSDWRSNVVLLAQIWCAIEKIALIAEALSQGQPDILNFKQTATCLETLVRTYVKCADPTTVPSDIEGFLEDLAFATNCVRKIMAERMRAMALKKGRDTAYNPIPAPLLASPSRPLLRNLSIQREMQNKDSDSMSSSSDCSLSSDHGDVFEEYSMHAAVTVVFDPDAIPVKSSLKSSAKAKVQSSAKPDKNVHFSASTCEFDDET